MGMRMNIYLDDINRGFLEAKARELGVSMSEFIGRLIDKEKKKEKKYNLKDLAHLAVSNVKPISNEEIDEAIYG